MGLFSSIFGGIAGGHAAGQAANAQIGASQEASGTYQNSVNIANELIRNATRDAGMYQLAQGERAIDGMNTATNQAIGGVNAAVQQGQSGVNDSTQQANAMLNPYMSGGNDALAQLLGRLQNPNQNIQMDPGFALRLQEGQKTLQNSAAARGNALGGAAMKAATRFGQDYSSNEYQNAFNRYNTVNQGLQGVAGLGLNASTQAGNNLTHAGQFNAALGMEGANTTGQMGQRAAVYNGDVGNQAWQYANNAMITGAAAQGQNGMNAGRFTAENQINAGNARANAIAGKFNSYNNMVGGIENSIQNMLMMGMGGMGGMGGAGGAGGGVSSGTATIPTANGGFGMGSPSGSGINWSQFILGGL